MVVGTSPMFVTQAAHADASAITMTMETGASCATKDRLTSNLPNDTSRMAAAQPERELTKYIS